MLGQKGGQVFHLIFFPQESEPISNYLNSDVPLEMKQKIARMGVNTILKMVS